MKDFTKDGHIHIGVVALVAYKWFVPYFVNQLPLRTLLICWDRLLLRHAPPVAGVASLGTNTSHMRLALALLSLSSVEVIDRVSAQPDEVGGMTEVGELTPCAPLPLSLHE